MDTWAVDARSPSRIADCKWQNGRSPKPNRFEGVFEFHSLGSLNFSFYWSIGDRTSDVLWEKIFKIVLVAERGSSRDALDPRPYRSAAVPGRRGLRITESLARIGRVS